MRAAVLLAWVLLLISGAVTIADEPADAKERLLLSAGQKEFLWLEPILVTVRIESARFAGLPASPGKSKLGTLSFAFDPAVPPRKGAKPLPLEAQGGELNAQARDYDLFEHFEFPGKGGSWTVKAIMEHEGTKLTSAEFAFSTRRPASGDAEHAPVARIHHAPWSNYETNAFCGDTFDLVKTWPDSRLARYSHYWNGRYSQNKKEYDKAIASYRIVVEKHADFALADDAEFGIVECLLAQKKIDEARKHSDALLRKLKQQAAKAGIKRGCLTAVQGLNDNLSQRIRGDVRTARQVNE
jgi:hypothetical protein